MARNNKHYKLLELVRRFIKTIAEIIGYCVIIKGLCNGSLIIDLIYYFGVIKDILITMTTGT